MELEYLEDPGSRTPRVLLLYGRDPGDVARLQEAIAPLVAAETGNAIDVASLPGFHGINGCSLIAQAGKSSLGVRPIESRPRAFRCVLTTAGWSQVSGLLEPFATDNEPGHEAHQYLNSDGPVEWIISTSRHW